MNCSKRYCGLTICLIPKIEERHRTQNTGHQQAGYKQQDTIHGTRREGYKTGDPPGTRTLDSNTGHQHGTRTRDTKRRDTDTGHKIMTRDERNTGHTHGSLEEAWTRHRHVTPECDPSRTQTPKINVQYASPRASSTRCQT